MNEIVIEAQARYLIEDRVRRTRRARAGASRRQHRLARQSWW
jgi:hypothetical protein